MKVAKAHKTFEGWTQFLEHDSQATGTPMRFSLFIPKGEIRGALFWLSGLSCTEENFIVKAGAQRYAAELGILLVCPDTSPRGLNLPGEHDASDFGSGAGFYLDATTSGYRDHYRMRRYVSEELHGWVESEFALRGRIAICGHSMGGHGALVLGLREPGKYSSISAFAPIVNPSVSPWGRKAFQGYLGEDPEAWRRYDACELLRLGASHPRTILVDQGTEDAYFKTELLTERLREACGQTGQDLRLRYQAGYDHSYFFISTFIGEHLRFHAQFFQSPTHPEGK